MMTFSESIKTCFKKYFSAKGRASRAEYWWFQLLRLGILVIPAICYAGNSDEDWLLGIISILYLSMIIPYICVLIRRLHDRGESAWVFLWTIIIPIPLFFILANIIAMLGSEKEDNKYGPYLLDSEIEINPILQNDIESIDLSKNGHEHGVKTTDVEL